jgi:hypothetical protein
MLKNITAVLVLTLICVGCRSNERVHSRAVKQPDKVILNVNIEQTTAGKNSVRREEPKTHKRSSAAPSRKKAPAPAPAPASRHRPAQEIVPRSSFENDLNKVEQQHLQEIRRRNRQQQMENEKRVFGGFSAGKLFK